MIKRDYYLILGVPREESQKGIQRAFRKLVKRYHPDIVGPKWSNRFRDIVEAYECLSDPESRRTYNRGIAHAEERETTRPEPIYAGHGAEPEPLIPEPASVMRDFRSSVEPFDALFERFARNFTGLSVPKSESPQALTVEIVLSPRDAMQGGRLPIRVPSVYPCPFCGGAGRDWLFECANCRGRGMIEEEETVELRIPPGVRHNEIYEVPLRGLGIHNLYLRVRIVIGS